MLKLQPKERWKIIFDNFKDIPLGESFNYKQMNDITGINVVKERSLIYQANKRLLPECKKMLINMRNVGYKIGSPDEQMKHGKNRRRKARKQVSKGMFELEHLDVSEMTDNQRKEQIFTLNYFQTSLRILRKRNIQTYEYTKEEHKMHKERAEASAESMKMQEETLERIKKMEEELEKLKK